MLYLGMTRQAGWVKRCANFVPNIFEAATNSANRTHQGRQYVP